MHSWSRLLGCLLLGIAPSSSNAATIPGLFNTGVGATGTLLGNGAIDPHYRLVQSDDAGAPGPNVVVVNDTSSPILTGPWAANGPNSKWVAPSADQNVGNAPGRFTYRISFDLTGLDPASAMITGRWNTDNDGVEVRLNGHGMGISKGTDFASFSPTFSITNFFVEGSNTLDFVVLNYSQGINPTAFRAELSGTAAVATPTNQPPSIQTQPASLTVAYKEAVSFSVVAQGTPPLQYQWRFNMTLIPGATNALLILPGATAANQGAYDVSIANAYGATNSSIATLTVLYQNSPRTFHETLGASSRRTGLVISEIMYHPTNRIDERNLEFIELYNSNPFVEDIGGWRITGDWDYTFPEGTRIGGNQFLVVSPIPADIQAVYGIAGVMGGFTNQLSNGSGTVRLRKKSGGIVLQVNYSDHRPWPLAADGTGHSLVLARPSFGENNPRAWDPSATKGGSPGAPDAIPADMVDLVAINELMAHSEPPLFDFVELYNRSPLPVDISGCWLSDEAVTNKFRIPDATTIPPFGFVVFNEATLGFGLSSEAETLYFINSNQTRVVDAVHVEGQDNGISYGRYPDGNENLYPLNSRTPGASNTRMVVGDVVINEIFFNPISGDADDQFIELYNRGAQSVDLSGWRFTDGISFVFPTNTQLGPGGFLVIAKNASRLQTNYPALNVNNLIGNFSDKLSTLGERVALAKPGSSIKLDTLSGMLVTNTFLIVVDEVTYNAGGRWGHWCDGGGSSLELISTGSNHRLAPNWGDSDETSKASWTIIENTGVLDLGWGPADRLQLFLLGPGEALLDDVEVLVGGVNRVGNGGFESGTNGWVFQGTHSKSSVEALAGGHSLHLRASDRGDQSANRIFTPLTSAIATGTVATIRAKVRWLRGHAEILLRLKGNYLEASGRLLLPANPGTPGLPNSRAQPNTGPAITAVMHAPILPAANQAIRITASVDDPDGIKTVALKYRLDPSTNYFTVPMTDDGMGSDLIAGDGVFTATINGQTGGTMLAYYMESTDILNPPVVTRFPPDAPARECLVRVGETQPAGGFTTYRLWMTTDTLNKWSTRPQMSNEDLDSTFVYGTNRVIYNSGARYSGSSSTAQGYNSPVGVLCGYSISLPSDDPFMGGTAVVLDWPVRDLTDQREQLMFWFLDQLGLPNMYRRYIHLHVNGVTELNRPNYPAQIGHGIYDDIQQPGADVLDEWFSNDNNGPLHKSNCWEEFNDAGTMEPVNCIKLNSLEVFTTTGGVRKLARYRWNWQLRDVHGSANDFTQLLALVDAVNAPPANYLNAVQSTVDVDHWMRTFLASDLAANWDSWGNFNAKNSYIYKPAKDGWKILSFDLDVGLGVLGSDGPTAPLFDPNDPTLVRMNNSPAFIRHYWCALSEAINGFFQTGPSRSLDAFLDARYAAFQAAGIPLGAPDSIKTFVAQRRSFLQGQLNAVTSTFTVNGPASFSSSQNPLTLSGTAPVTVHSITINGIDYDPVWTSVTNWTITLPLGSPTNTLNIAAWNRSGAPLFTATRVVIYTGPLPPPVELFINEWMADNSDFLVNPLTGHYDDWFELYNPSTNAVQLGDFTFSDDFTAPQKSRVPNGFFVPARGFLFVWADGTNGAAIGDTNLHAAFSLGKSGETLSLYDPFGRQIDSVAFGVQSKNVSQGRWRDASTNLFFMETPTPGAPNQIPNLSPQILSIVLIDAAHVTLTWRVQPGRSYRIQTRSHLTDIGWMEIQDSITATQATCTATVGIVPGQAFFRVKVE